MSRAVTIAWLLIALAFTASVHGRKTSGSRSHSSHTSHSYPSHSGLSGSSRPKSHSYPASSGLSGSNSHHYPASGGLSGHGSGSHHTPIQQSHATGLNNAHNIHGSHSNGHAYPPSNGLSGSNIHHHNSGTTNVHHASGGLSGHNSGSHHTPIQQSHATGLNNAHNTQGSHSNGHAYPPSNGFSGSNIHNPNSGTTNVHYHSHVYNPPPQIHYTPVHGSAPMNYPVYHGTPPVYVHEFRDSGSKFSTLLAGLALYNLGRSSSHHDHHYINNNNNNHNNNNRGPSSDGDEKCSLRIEEGRNLERVKIPCYIVSTFNDVPQVPVTTVQQSVSVNTPSVTPQPILQPLPTVPTTLTPSNTTFAVNATSLMPQTNDTSAVPQTNDTSAVPAVNSTVQVPITNVTIAPIMAAQQNTSVLPTQAPQPTLPEPVDARQVKGEPVKLSNAAKCFVERITKTRTSLKEIECGLLQQYALQSMQKQQQRQQRPRSPNSATDHSMSMNVLFTVTLSAYIICVSIV